jgi:hypothetical protein
VRWIQLAGHAEAEVDKLRASDYFEAHLVPDDMAYLSFSKARKRPFLALWRFHDASLSFCSFFRRMIRIGLSRPQPAFDAALTRWITDACHAKTIEPFCEYDIILLYDLFIHPDKIGRL